MDSIPHYNDKDALEAYIKKCQILETKIPGNDKEALEAYIKQCQMLKEMNIPGTNNEVLGEHIKECQYVKEMNVPFGDHIRQCQKRFNELDAIDRQNPKPMTLNKLAYESFPISIEAQARGLTLTVGIGKIAAGLRLTGIAYNPITTEMTIYPTDEEVQRLRHFGILTKYQDSIIITFI